MKSPRHIPLLLGLLALFTAMRWPGLWSDGLKGFSPVYAIFFCAGLYFRGWQVWAIPVGLMFISDLVINHWYYTGSPLMGGYMLSNYAMWLGIGLAGWFLRNERHTALLVGGSTLGACVFYVVSNSVAWLGNPAYQPKVWATWVQALTVGQPGAFPPAWVFFRNTLISSALFTLVIVVAVNYARARRSADEAEFEPKA